KLDSAGVVVEYVSDTPLANPDFSNIFQYLDQSRWRFRTGTLADEDFTNAAQWLPLLSSNEGQVGASITSSIIEAFAGDVVVSASPHETSASIVAAASGSGACGGTAGVGASGAGAGAENHVSVAVGAVVDTALIVANSVSLTAEDTSTVKSDVGAGS